jgi:hypothetical protein
MVGHKQAYVMLLNPFKMHLKKDDSDNCIRFGMAINIRIFVSCSIDVKFVVIICHLRIGIL